MITLNEYQRAAVEDESRACLVKANVGSGKTTVLVEKLRWLHEKKQIPYERMVVLTFTNKAANEIRVRLGERPLSDERQGKEADFACFGTFHSVALSMLRSQLPIETLGYRPDFTVIDPDEEVDLALALTEMYGLQIKYKNRLKKRIEQEEKAWRQGREQPRLKDELFRLFSLLEKEKIRLNRFSFSDLIRVAAQLLRSEAVEKPDWIIVDEVQDSDRQQLDFISALMGEKTHLFAVGDPNQVIYSWRGGAENIFYLLSHMFDARELTLPVNYRSNAAILDAARSFQQSGERLQGIRQGGMPVQVRNHYDSFGEAQYLADRITELITDGVPAKEIAVFYRLQNQSEILEKEFARRNIPYYISLKKTAADLPVIRWLIRRLRCICDSEDHGSALAVLTDKQYGPGLTAKKAQAAETAFLAGQSEIGQQTFPDSAEKLYDLLGLDSALHPTRAAYAQEKELVLEFLDQAVRYRNLKREQDGADIRSIFNAFLGEAALYGLQIGQQQGTEKERNAVHLMTLHASKGLEFQYVFIIGVNNGLIPLVSGSEGDEEEERRLFFVGMTRAKDHLELSFYTNPGTPRVFAGESRYLSMIPPHLLCREGQDGAKKADLTAMRRAVMKLREERSIVMSGGTEEDHAEDGCTEQKHAGKEASAVQPEGEEERGIDVQPQRVRHDRYGTGTVLEENDSKIKVLFDGLGEKEFMKAFVVLEKIPE